MVSARIAALIASRLTPADAASVLREAGIDAALLEDPDARIPLPVEQSLWDRAAELADDPLFGLHAAEALRPGHFDVLDYAVRTAPTLRESLRRLARYNRLLHDSARFELVDSLEGLRIEHRLAEGAATVQAAEFTLASLVVIGRQLRPGLAAREVAFAHSARADPADYERVFGLRPAFGAGINAVTLPVADLDAPLPQADAALSRIVTAHAEHLLACQPAPEEALRERLRRLIAARLGEGPVTLATAASEVHMSERQLQRRLAGEGCRFADLHDDVRRELALRYLADRRLSLGEIAFLLGFAEPSPFHRAFRRWTGLSPAAARRAAASKPPLGA